MKSLLGPVLLIAVGVVFLLSNLGIVPISDVRALLSTWWPLILIVIGLWLVIERSLRR